MQYIRKKNNYCRFFFRLIVKKLTRRVKKKLLYFSKLVFVWLVICRGVGSKLKIGGVEGGGGRLFRNLDKPNKDFSYGYV